MWYRRAMFYVFSLGEGRGGPKETYTPHGLSSFVSLSFFFLVPLAWVGALTLQWHLISHENRAPKWLPGSLGWVLAVGSSFEYAG